MVIPDRKLYNEEKNSIFEKETKLFLLDQKKTEPDQKEKENFMEENK